MGAFFTQQLWFDRLLPEGLPLPNVSLVGYVGDNSLPLLGNIIVASWLRQGGSVVFLSLQNLNFEVLSRTIKKNTRLDLAYHKDRIAFIELDPTLNQLSPINNNSFRANLLKTDVLGRALERASILVPNEKPGILIYCYDIDPEFLDLPTCKLIIEKMKEVGGDKNLTFIISVKLSGRTNQLIKLVTAADNFFMDFNKRSPQGNFIQIKRIKNAPFLKDRVRVPLNTNLLAEVKSPPTTSKNSLLPLIF